jgi:hypothetical protein
MIKYKEYCLRLHLDIDIYFKLQEVLQGDEGSRTKEQKE